MANTSRDCGSSTRGYRVAKGPPQALQLSDVSGRDEGAVAFAGVSTLRQYNAPSTLPRSAVAQDGGLVLVDRPPLRYSALYESRRFDARVQRREDVGADVPVAARQAEAQR